MMAAPAAVPTAAPAPSCGAPETRPDAMAGPKMPRPNRVSAPISRLSASAISGSPPTRAVSSPNRLVPMPIMTASTMTLMPDDTTLPSTRSARNLRLFHSPNGTSPKPANADSITQPEGHTYAHQALMGSP